MARVLALLTCLLLAAGCPPPAPTAIATGPAGGGGGAAPIADLHVRAAFVVPPFAGPPPMPATRPAQPSLRGDDFGSITSWGGAIRVEQIELLEGLIAETNPRDPEMADLLARLGEMHVRVQHEALLRGDTAEAERALQEATKAYSEAIAYANYARRDQVLYSLGHALAAGGLPDKANKIYASLIKEHPTSRYVVDAYIALADHQFASGALDEASALYGRALELSEGPRAHYVVYRQAWISLARDAFADALATFAKVIGDASAGAPSLASTARAEADALCAWRGELAVAAGGPELVELAAVGSPCAAVMLPRIGFAARARHAEALAVGAAAAADQALVLYDLYLADPTAADHAETLLIAAELAWHRAAIEADPAVAAPLWTAAAARFDAAGLIDVAGLARENAERIRTAR